MILTMATSEAPSTPSNFIRQIIDKDLDSGKHSNIVTRFPPEPNGYLHVGHAKSICLNFGIAQSYQGVCNLRFDDTNPEKENPEYIESIRNDVEWLGFQWPGEPKFASNYFDQLHGYAIELIKAGKAYVCELTPDEARQYRGNLKEPGKDSPYRNRSVEENLDLFDRMKNGEFEEGKMVLRAKIDMASPNMNMRDPIIYRIRFAEHHQTGDKWCVYPMYDFTHPISDALEGITHSLCTLEFEDHRPLYDWLLDNISIECHPQQIEFARLQLNYTVTSKRKLKQLVDEGHVTAWNDPRMPTISGMRRRGYTPAAIRRFCDSIGVAKANSTVDVAMLEAAIRDDLNDNAPRAMCVLNPLKITIQNYPEGQVEQLSAPLHPQKEMGERTLPFTREVFIDKDDFREEANKKFKRLVLGKEVRLRNAYVIRADEVIKDADGEITEIICTHDPDTLGKNPEDGRKVKGVIHWVSATESLPAEVRLYDRLFLDENPDGNKEKSFLELINPEALTVVKTARVEPSVAEGQPEQGYQFEREGYFCIDSKDSQPDQLVLNKTIGLRDTWAKIGD
ncbi:glutamine--tRNA ligase [Litoribrevibacter albus]|uniref:Glutamine--tRNA ligase n=2 Tax=Litoribrevibacter albus TaxID=1473156 RepID=A0AA37SD47_9GAMM|nr:glutamine--tRNA ligase [Litoribrevibacter albus]